MLPTPRPRKHPPGVHGDNAVVVGSEARARWPWLGSAPVIFLLALWRYHQPTQATPLCGTGFESLQLACSLAATGTFADPFLVLPTGPSAHLAPLFPACVSLLLRLPAGLAAAGLAWSGMVALALHLALLPWAGQRLGLGAGAGIVASATFLLAGVPLEPVWEAFYVALLGVIVTPLMHDVLKRRATTGMVLALAVLWGVGLWLSPALAGTVATFVAWAALKGALPRRHLLALLLGPLLVVSPWLARNALLFHQAVFVRDNLGLELAVSNNPCATFWFETNALSGCAGTNHPNTSLEQARRVQQLGEVEYNHQRLREALAWMDGHREAVLVLTAQRVAAFWFPPVLGPVSGGEPGPLGTALVWLMTLLGVPGLWLAWRRDASASSVLLAWLLGMAPIHAFIQVFPRYRFPILWVSLLAGGFVLTQLAGAVLRRRP